MSTGGDQVACACSTLNPLAPLTIWVSCCSSAARSFKRRECFMQSRGVGSGEWGVGNGDPVIHETLFPTPHSPLPTPTSPLFILVDVDVFGVDHVVAGFP